MGDSEEESSTSDSQEIETQSEASIFSTPGPGAVSGSRSYAAAAVASAAGEAASAEDVPARNEHDVSDGQTKALLEEREKLRQERSDLALSLKALEAQLAGMTSAAELNAKKEKLSRKLDSLRAKEKSMREAVPENSPVGDGAAEAESPGAGDSGSAVRRLEAARVLANACRRVLLPYAAELSAAGDRGASPSQSPRTAMVSAFLRDGLLSTERRWQQQFLSQTSELRLSAPMGVLQREPFPGLASPAPRSSRSQPTAYGSPAP
eukprot:TRINITY_DN30034_c0_g2_i4.p1 TRINITY_DN30034_c0_g2~~TRINITY_DN30034_c0_g2_i4.p1  ORF type:complete len:264 (+),score=78.97 TRINITY_DN30034_c0_g2_i4:89-880(+)